VARKAGRDPQSRGRAAEETTEGAERGNAATAAAEQENRLRELPISDLFNDDFCTWTSTKSSMNKSEIGNLFATFSVV
jgi:hypothetical protein